jgi:uncharacterized protein (DUF4415 family)
MTEAWHIAPQTDLKVAISIRLDYGVLMWFKQQQPRGYQTLINDVLKKYIELHEANSPAIVQRTTR